MGIFGEVIYMAKLTLILFVLLLLGCEEQREQEQECDAICEIHRANFENSTIGVVFSSNHYIYRPPRPSARSNVRSTYVSVTKTTEGAIARYKSFDSSNPLEAELSMEEWQDFIRALCKCRISEWKKRPGRGANLLEIYSSDKDAPYFKFPIEWETYPKEFFKVIDDMAAKVEKKGKRVERERRTRAGRLVSLFP